LTVEKVEKTISEEDEDTMKSIRLSDKEKEMTQQPVKLTIAIIGAAGKMGIRITDNLVGRDYGLLFCEKGEGIARLHGRGLLSTGIEEAVPVSDTVIMAVPDAKMGEISKHVVPLMKKNATIILLDPAAAYAGELALRDDCTFVITHPCHPPLFGEEDTAEARNDFFGGIAAKQDIVIALLHGNEENFQKAQQVCIEMFAPVVKCHRITVEQMAILEPAAAEVVAASAACLMKEALDEAVKHGVPEEAARAFMLGHIQIPLAIVFGKISSPFSDAAKIAIECGYDRIFKADWKEIFRPEVLEYIIQKMLHPEEAMQ